MSFPKLLSRLFQNSGAGTMLNPEIIPTDTALSATSTYPVANKVVKAAIDAKTFPVDTAMSTTSTNAVQNKVVTAAINTSGYQVGDLRLYAGSDVPSGWFRCDGSTVTNMATNYPKLYAVLGTNVLPNHTGRYPLGSASNINALVSAGLPNIIGSFYTLNSTNTVSGAFSKTGESGDGDGGSGGTHIIGFDASMSNSIYGASSTVTPLSVKVAILIRHD